MSRRSAARLLPGAGGAHRLAQRIARNVATEIILTGAPIDAQRGFSLGLVNRLAAPGQALSVALELAAPIAANAPLAVQYSLDLVRRSAACDDAAARAMSEAALAELRRSKDYQEGIRAFVEKRAPMWKGQ